MMPQPRHWGAFPCLNHYTLLCSWGVFSYTLGCMRFLEYMGFVLAVFPLKYGFIIVQEVVVEPQLRVYGNKLNLAICNHEPRYSCLTAVTPKFYHGRLQGVAYSRLALNHSASPRCLNTCLLCAIQINHSRL